jgi:methionine-S-sulfoxide reductase
MIKSGYTNLIRLLLPSLVLVLMASCVNGDRSGLEVRGPESSRGEVAILAGGCFWCLEPPYAELPGILGIEVGFTGGTFPNPTYDQVVRGQTDHVEAVRIVFDPSKVSYREILVVFWQQIDPTDAGGQFADRGDHYRTAIYVNSPAQRAVAEETKTTLDASGIFRRALVTTIEPAGVFYVAEDYHQQFFLKQPRHYQQYARGSGRTGFIQRHADRVRAALENPPQPEGDLTPGS